MVYPEVWWWWWGVLGELGQEGQHQVDQELAWVESGGGELTAGTEQVLKAMVVCKDLVTDTPEGKSEGHIFSMQLIALALAK